VGLIAGLEEELRGVEGAGAPELAALLEELLGAGGRPWRLACAKCLWRSRVYRLHFSPAGAKVRTDPESAGGRSLVVKRLPLDRAHREQRAVRRWLPHVGLAEHGPPLLGVAAARGGECVWHVYGDLGDRTLATVPQDVASVRAAVRVIAEVHARFGRSGLLGECREFGVDLGTGFFSAGVRDAIRALEALRRRPGGLGPELATPVDRLLARLHVLLDQAPERTRLLATCGGPETLLHGDLWTCNVFVLPAPGGVQVRLIDWDHAGVGHATYDLSAFLLRFPPAERAWILDCYAEEARRLDWPLPERDVLDPLFETAELARLVSLILWPALELLAGPADWVAERFVDVERWFAAIQPVLPGRGEVALV
jgi:hypothetical protein